MTKSRIYLGLKNVKVSLVFTIINTIVQFLTRKVFIEYMGLEVMGLNSTAMNFLRFLNFAELGIVSGVRFMLYRPCHDHDVKTINDIITLQGLLYRYISLVIFGCGCILMCFFPLIFEGYHFPLWMAYASFTILMAGSLAGNFFNYRQIMFSVTQTGYKITIGTNLIMLIKMLLQMLSMYIFDKGYVCWLVCECVFCPLNAAWVYRKTRRDFPFLRMTDKKLRTLISEYSVLVVKVRQLLFHRISSIVYLEMLPLIIFALISLEEVTLYGNYQAIFKGVSAICAASIAGVMSGVGDLIAENNREKTLKVFHELFAIRFAMAAIVSISLYFLCQPMISLWLGKEFLFGNLTVLLMIFTLFIAQLRATIDMFIQGSGLFHDTWAPIVETIVNISGAIAGGYLFGLNGIIGGYRLGSVFILLIWKPTFFFRQQFNSSPLSYNIHFLKDLGIMSGSALICHFFVTHIHIATDTSWLRFFIFAIVTALMTISAVVIFMSFFDLSFRSIMKKLIIKKP